MIFSEHIGRIFLIIIRFDDRQEWLGQFGQFDVALIAHQLADRHVSCGFEALINNVDIKEHIRQFFTGFTHMIDCLAHRPE